MDDIQMAQVAAAENAVVDRLRQKGLLPSDSPTEDVAALERCKRIEQRQQFESALATAFVSMQGTRNAAERQGLWLECLRLAKELEKLNDPGSDK